MVHNIEIFLARILYNKYVKLKRVLDVQTKGGHLVTWRGITKSLKRVHDGFGWTIAQDISGSLWFDAWLSTKPLCSVVNDIKPSEITWIMVNIINDEVQWVVSRVRTVLPTIIL